MKRIAQWFEWFLLTPALLPLVYVDGLLYPYVAPKTLLLRALGILACAAFFFITFQGHPLYWSRLKKRSTWIPGMLVAVAYTTSLVGVDFYHSFWSIFDRGDGLLTLTVVTVFFYIAVLSVRQHFFRRLFVSCAWVGFSVALYATLQWAQEMTGMDLPLIERPQGRLGATFGNAAFLASYLGMTLCATVAIARAAQGWKRWAFSFMACTQLFAVVLTSTRGTILAFIALGALGLASWTWRAKGRARLFACGVLIAAVLCVGIVVKFRTELSRVHFEPIRRIATISKEDGTVSSRLFAWRNILHEALQRPLTGYGAEHVSVLFNRVYDPSKIIEQWFDRSHNAYLDYFVQFGLFGVFLYILMIATFGWMGVQLMRSSSIYGVPIVSFVFVYAVQNFFVFDTASTLWLLFAAYAGVLVLTDTSLAFPLRFPVHTVVSFIVCLAIVLSLYPIVVQPLRANLALAQGYRDHVIQVERAVRAMNRGLSLHTYADVEYGYQAYTMYTERQKDMLQGHERVHAYRYARDTLEKNFARYPYDARTATYFAHVLDSAPPEEPVDETLLRAVLARAIELSPKRAQAPYIFANISLKKGDAAGSGTDARTRSYTEAIRVLEAYAARATDFAEPRYILANLYLLIGDRDAAARWADEGLRLYTAARYQGITDVTTRAARYYIAVKDWAHATRFLGVIVAANQQDYQSLYDFAKTNFLSGNREQALQIVEQLRREEPQILETDPVFMKAINSDVSP